MTNEWPRLTRATGACVSRSQNIFSALSLPKMQTPQTPPQEPETHQELSPLDELLRIGISERNGTTDALIALDPDPLENIGVTVNLGPRKGDILKGAQILPAIQQHIAFGVMSSATGAYVPIRPREALSVESELAKGCRKLQLHIDDIGIVRFADAKMRDRKTRIRYCFRSFGGSNAQQPESIRAIIDLHGGYWQCDTPRALREMFEPWLQPNAELYVTSISWLSAWVPLLTAYGTLKPQLYPQITTHITTSGDKILRLRGLKALLLKL